MSHPILPDPRSVRRWRQGKGDWADGASFTNGSAINWVVPCAGVRSIRMRIKTTTAGGALSAAFLRGLEDSSTAYEENNPSDVSVTAGTETKMDVATHYGEPAIKFTFTPGGNGTLDYADCMFGY